MKLRRLRRGQLAPLIHRFSHNSRLLARTSYRAYHTLETRLDNSRVLCPSVAYFETMASAAEASQATGELEAAIARSGIRVFAFDFDMTLVNLHAYNSRVKAAEVPNRWRNDSKSNAKIRTWCPYARIRCPFSSPNFLVYRSS